MHHQFWVILFVSHFARCHEKKEISKVIIWILGYAVAQREEKNIFGENNFGDTLNFEFVYAYREDNFRWTQKACDGAKRKKHL
jgi:hypothetical protein